VVNNEQGTSNKEYRIMNKELSPFDVHYWIFFSTRSPDIIAAVSHNSSYKR